VLQSNDVPGDKATNAGIIGTYFAKYGHDLIHLQEVCRDPIARLEGSFGLTWIGLQLPCVHLRHRQPPLPHGNVWRSGNRQWAEHYLELQLDRFRSC
jgi:hypothetical protein